MTLEEYEKYKNLIHAIEANDYKAVLASIEEGANVTAANTDSTAYFSPMHAATQHADANIIQLLLNNGADIDTNPDPLNFGTPLRLAVLYRDVAAVKKILQFEPDLESIGPGNCHAMDQTPLHVAITPGNLEIVNLLLEAGANVNAFVERYEETGFIETPLITALIESSEDIALRLIEAGAKLDTISGHDGSTLLHCATSYPQVMRKLIEHRLDVNATNKEGDTPLHVAVFGCNRESAELLIEQGANLETTNRKEVTPLQLAAYDAARGGMRAETDIFALLLEKGAKFDKQQCLAYITQHHNQAASMYPHLHPNPEKELQHMKQFIKSKYLAYCKAQKTRTFSQATTLFRKGASPEKSATQLPRRKRPKSR
jgi:ankyrin repeat protein